MLVATSRPTRVEMPTEVLPLMSFYKFFFQILAKNSRGVGMTDLYAMMFRDICHLDCIEPISKTMIRRTLQHSRGIYSARQRALRPNKPLEFAL